jgi:hypothetical protein
LSDKYRPRIKQLYLILLAALSTLGSGALLVCLIFYFFYMARYITLTLIAIILTTNVANAANGNRDTRTYHDETIWSLSGGWVKLAEGESGFSGAIGFDQALWKSDFFLGFQAHGATVANTDLHNRINIVGMDVALSYKIELGALYIHPKVFAGLGMVSHNTVMETEPDMFGDYNRIERQQSYFAPEVGGRIDVGVQMGKFGIGAYASYTKQFGQYAPTSVNENLTVTKEWLTQSPFEAGIAIRWDIDNGIKHSGGNDLPIMEAFGGYGSKGVEAGAQLIFQRNNGLPWLIKEEQSLRGEYIASSHYGIRFAMSEPTGDCRLTAQVGYGLFFTPKGPDCVHCFRTMVWLGVGEARAEATTTTGEANGSFGSVQATPKGNVEVSYILRPFKDYRRFYFIATAGAAYQYIPGTSADGASTIVSQSTEKPFSFYGSLGVALPL